MRVLGRTIGFAVMPAWYGCLGQPLWVVSVWAAKRPRAWLQRHQGGCLHPGHGCWAGHPHGHHPPSRTHRYTCALKSIPGRTRSSSTEKKEDNTNRTGMDILSREMICRVKVEHWIRPEMSSIGVSQVTGDRNTMEISISRKRPRLANV